MLLKLTKTKLRRSLLLAVLVLLGCQIASPTPPDTGSEATGMPSPAAAIDQVPSPTAGPVPTADIPTPSAEMPTIEIAYADGSIAQAPVLGPSDYYDIFKTGVEDGLWTEVEGVLTLLRLIAGELDETAVPGADRVENRLGTGVVHHAVDLLETPDLPAETAAEIERLLNVVSPSQAALDAVSMPADEFSAASGRMARPAAQELSCQDLEARGFDPEDVQPGTVCFLFILLQMEGQDYRVYYPSEWAGDDEKVAWVDLALDAIIDSIPVYAGLGEVRPAHIVFSQRTEFDEDRRDIGGVQEPASFESDCAVAMYGISLSVSPDQFKQMLAHELFHCFQDWNLFKKPYSEHEWWAEGSAEYFSNVVYPAVNFEHRATTRLNYNSLNESLMDMAYENFAFFQHLANHIGNQGLIDLLEEMSFSGGSDAHASYLAEISYMPGLFQDLFVTFSSTGIPDSGGGVIAPGKIAVRPPRPIEDEEDYDFSAEPWVGVRYSLKYDQEKRFVQSEREDGEGEYGIVLAKLRRDRSAWSSLPEEIRSSCEEDSPYLLVTTIVKASYTITASVSEVEVAECDPCVLGAWDIDRESFAEYILGVMESSGGEDFDLEITGGHYYVEFMEEGRATSLRDDLTVRLGLPDPSGDGSAGQQDFTAVINGHGEGDYSADGETLTFLTWLEVIDDATGFVQGGQVAVELDSGMLNTSFFGQTTSAEVGMGPGAEESSNHSMMYTCDENILEVEQADGTVRFFRVEEIPPTEVPTEFPEGNPEP